MGAISAEPLYVRVDASMESGIGHFMRCFALAQYWREQGGEVTFAGAVPTELKGRLDTEGIRCADIDHPHPDPQDLRRLETLVPDNALVVIDGYQFDADYCGRLAKRCRVLVIDDYGHRSAYAGDILLNQNASADTIRYAAAPTVRLFGTRYALLGKRFRTLAPQPRQAGQIHRVLVTFGGADSCNVTLDALHTIIASPLGDVAISVVVGPANPNHDQLVVFAADHANLEIVSGDFDMATLMADCDLAISAAGSTCLELAYLGVPMVLVPIADNQLGIAAVFGDCGAALAIDAAPPLDRIGLTAALESIVASPDLMSALSTQAQTLVDGDGVVRVANALCQLPDK